MKKNLYTLPFANNALEPYISEEIVLLHHQKHHQSYVDGYNTTREKLDVARNTQNFAHIKHLNKDLAFHASGDVLHTLYWQNLAPVANQTPEINTLEIINRDFSSLEVFVKEFEEVAKTVEGSGWAVAGIRDGQIEIVGCEKHQDVAIWGLQPLLVCDVWEHAYYLQYQNRRAEYVQNFWKIVNWSEVEKRLLAAK